MVNIVFYGNGCIKFSLILTKEIDENVIVWRWRNEFSIMGSKCPGNFVLKSKKGTFRGFFLGFLFRCSACFGNYFIIDGQFYRKMLDVVITGVFIDIVIKCFLFLLAPFDEQTFIADYFSFQGL